MNGSIFIGNFLGIPVRLHWTFLVMFVFLLQFEQQGTGMPSMLLVLVGAFGSVFLHELGHSVVARRMGIRVLDITFWPLGGMARMTEMPESSRIEGLVAIAGPAVNFVLAAIGLVAMALLPMHGFGFELFRVLTLINVAMGTFNLIPAFPMDGGRILRAWLARTNDWVEATARAVRVGRFFAALMVLFPIFFSLTSGSTGFCIMPLIALFVWITGAKELLAVRLRHGQSPFGNVAFGGTEFGGQPFGGPADRNAQETEWRTRTQSAPTHDADDPTGARRPTVWEPNEDAQPLSEERVRELERYRGRLRRPKREE